MRSSILSGAIMHAALGSIAGQAQPVAAPPEMYSSRELSCADIEAEGQQLNLAMSDIQHEIRTVEVSDDPARAAAAAGTGLMILETLGGVAGIVPGAATSAANIAMAKAAQEQMRAELREKQGVLDTRLDAALDRMDELAALYEAKCK